MWGLHRFPLCVSVAIKVGSAFNPLTAASNNAIPTRAQYCFNGLKRTCARADVMCGQAYVPPAVTRSPTSLARRRGKAAPTTVSTAATAALSGPLQYHPRHHDTIRGRGDTVAVNNTLNVCMFVLASSIELIAQLVMPRPAATTTL